MSPMRNERPISKVWGKLALRLVPALGACALLAACPTAAQHNPAMPPNDAASGDGSQSMILSSSKPLLPGVSPPTIVFAPGEYPIETPTPTPQPSAAPVKATASLAPAASGAASPMASGTASPAARGSASPAASPTASTSPTPKPTPTPDNGLLGPGVGPSPIVDPTAKFFASPSPLF